MLTSTLPIFTNLKTQLPAHFPGCCSTSQLLGRTDSRGLAVLISSLLGRERESHINSQAESVTPNPNGEDSFEWSCFGDLMCARPFDRIDEILIEGVLRSNSQEIGSVSV